MISADPNVPLPDDLQTHNRYTYVLNNPLSYTDPSGYFFDKIFGAIGNFFKDNWRPIVAIAAVATIAIGGPHLFGVVGNTLFEFGFAVAGGAVAGGINDGLRGAGIGALTAAAFFGLGEAFGSVDFGTLAYAAKTVAHGIVGGSFAMAQGGEFQHGFLAAAAAQAAAPGIDKVLPDGGAGGYAARISIAASVGGTIDELSGGDFGNGAVTGAFSYMFRSLAQNINKGAPAQQSSGEWREGYDVYSFDEDYIREEVHMLQADITTGVNKGGSVAIGQYRHYVVVGIEGNPLSNKRFLLASGNYVSGAVDAFHGIDWAVGGGTFVLQGSPSTLSGQGISWNVSVGTLSISLAWDGSGNYVGRGFGVSASPLPVSGAAFISETHFERTYTYFKKTDVVYFGNWHSIDFRERYD